MKIEKRNNHKKKIVIGGMVLAGALVVGILATSYSKYRVTESIKLGEGIVNYSSADFELVGMYLINEDNTETKIDTVPGTGYILNEEKTKCTVNNTEINASIEYKDNKLYFGDITSKGTKCKVYFEEKKVPNASDTIISNTTVKTGTDSFKNIATVEDSGLYSTTDDDGTTYYYRGILSDTTVNNWVEFAGFKWRIIRINGDGSIRLIYNGTGFNQTGLDTQIGTKAFNSSTIHNAYVGYMYGKTTDTATYDEIHTNTNPSTIMGNIDGTDSGSLNYWYKTNILNKTNKSGKSYDEYISKDTGFCGDRQVQSVGGSFNGSGTGKEETSYAPWARLHSASSWKTTQTPTLNCKNIDNDLYTVTTSLKGNQALTYPIGLITSDEVVYSGGFGGSKNSTFWLYTNQSYWTMSPGWYLNSYGASCATVFFVLNNGILSSREGMDATSNTLGVRPVINLEKNVQLTGSGTTTDPYKIVE